MTTTDGTHDESLLHSAPLLAEAERRVAELRAQGVADKAQLSALQSEIASLRTALESRAVIEQAKGIIIGSTGCDADAAFDVLARQSQHENRKLREVAEELVRSKQRR
ncbi:MAG TPA: ANTAR domain-containing protein [Acidimicrobiales bacterium]|nr:ANTAR domain-containing protein [Acidimicrobiales bacterium]